MDLGSIYSGIELKLDKFETSITKALEGFYKLQTGTEKASVLMDKSVFTSVSNIEKSYKLWEESSDKTGRSIVDQSKKIDSYKERIKLLGTEIDKSEKTLGDLEKQFGKDSKEAQNFTSHVLDLKLAQSKLNQELENTEQQTGTLRGRVKMLSQEYDRLGQKNEMFTKMGQGMTSLGDKMTTRVTLPILGIGTASAKMAMDFTSGMAKVNTIANLNAQDLAKLSKETLKLSDDTGVAAKDLTEMEYSALSASVAMKDLTSVVKTSGTLSKGGFAEANDSLRLLTATYNVFKDSFDKGNISQAQASKMISDKMIAIQNMGETTVGQLASHLGQLTPIAKAAGSSLDEVGAGMIVLTKNGVETSQAVTGLKALYTNLVKPSEEAIKMSHAIGYTGNQFGVVGIKAKGLGGFLQDLKGKLSNTHPALIKAADDVSRYQHAIDNATTDQKKNKEQMREWNAGLKTSKENLKVLSKSGGETTSQLGQLFGSVEALSAVLNITSEYGMKDFQAGLDACKNSAGSTEAAAAKMAETTTEKFNRSLNKVKNRGIELGMKLLPHVEKAMGYISNLADKFAQLGPAAQDNLIKVAAGVALLGPALGITGRFIMGIAKMGNGIKALSVLTKSAGVAAEVAGVTSAMTSTAGAAGAASVATAGFTSSIGATLLVAAPYLAVAAGVGAAGYGIYKAFDKSATPAVDLFGSKMKQVTPFIDAMGNKSQIVTTKNIKFAESTKQLVGAYMKLNDGASKALMGFYTNSTKITDQTSKQLMTQYNNLGNQIKKGADDKFNALYLKTQNHFKNSKALTDKEEQKILKDMAKNNTSKKKVVDGYLADIKKILDKATKEKRALTLNEQKEINALQDKMKVNAVKTLSATELESKVILERIKSYGVNITAEQSGEIIKNAETTRVKSVDAANKQFLESKAQFEYMRDVTKELTHDQAEKLIAEAERQKKIAIEKADALKEGVVKKITEMNPDIKEQVDLQTGTLKTGWDKFFTWWNNSKLKKHVLEVVNTVTDVVVPHAVGVNEAGKLANRQAQEDAFLARKAKGYASGTEDAERGVNEVAENGFEIVTGRQYRWFNGGEKVLNHDKSKALLNSLLGNSKASSEKVAKEAMVQAKDIISVKPRISVNESTSKKNAHNVLNGTDKNAHKNFTGFVNKLNADEVKQTKSLLSQDYKARVDNLNDRLKALKAHNGKMSSEEKAQVDKQIANLQKLSRGTKDKKAKNQYADKIAQLRQYAKECSKSSKSNTAAQVANLEKSKKALKGHYDFSVGLLTKRTEAVKKQIELSENLFKGKMNTYETAIERLGRDTGNLNTNLENQKAIVIIQKDKAADLEKQYRKLAGAFGSASDEATEAKKAYEDSKTQLIDYEDAVIEADDKITQSHREMFDTYKSNVDNFTEKIKSALTAKYQEAQKAQEDLLGKDLERLEKGNQRKLESIDNYYNKEVKTAEEASDKIIKAKEKEIKAIDSEISQHEAAEKNKESAERETELRRLLSLNFSKKKKLELQKELDQLLKDKADRNYKESVDKRKEALQAEMEKEKEALEAKKKDLEKAKEDELRDIKALFEKTKEDLESKLAACKVYYEDKLKAANITAETEKLIVDKNQKEIVNLLSSYGNQYEDVGMTLGDKLLCGFRGKMDDLNTLMMGTIGDIKTALTTDIDFNNVGGALYAQNTSKPPVPMVTNNSSQSNNSTKIGSLFTAENVYLGNKMDVEQVAQELGYHTIKVLQAKGVK